MQNKENKAKMIWQTCYLLKIKTTKLDCGQGNKEKRKISVIATLIADRK
jgi:hypothetical protein